MTKYKKARGIKGHCEVCGRWVGKGDYFITDGTDGHGALIGLTHEACDKESIEPKEVTDE